MRIGIISDTHDHSRNVRKAVEVFREHAVQWVLHAGDIVSAHTAEAFSDLGDSTFIAVCGNCDCDRAALRSTIEGFGGELYDRSYQGRIDGKAVYMAHALGSAQVVHGQGYDLVVHGHTHRQAIQRVGKTLIVNPGEATNRRSGFGRVVILDLVDMSTTTVSLD